MNPISEIPKAIFPLSAVTRRLKELLLEVESKQFWVQAQFIPENSGQATAGHCYGQLVENGANGRTIARMRAVIWRSARVRIEQKLQHAGGLLTQQQEICALSAVRFHPVFGLSLEISDVDPTLGVSLLEKNRHEVLERLRVANLLDLNKGIALPVAALRIGLITASGSAALADFTKTLLLSGFSFRISFVPATMQGETSPAQVIKAIRLLERQDIDVICLVRGGGSAPVEKHPFAEYRAAAAAIATGSLLSRWPTRQFLGTRQRILTSRDIHPLALLLTLAVLLNPL
jgi:exodeoxyribonuclease VII large subunit